jgi:RNA polymerase sigma-70 factor (ECF subfamily)
VSSEGTPRSRCEEAVPADPAIPRPGPPGRRGWTEPRGGRLRHYGRRGGAGNGKAATVDAFPETQERSLTDITTLVERCRRGDELAWEALVRRYESRVYSVALHYTREAEEARDIAQDLFVRIYRNLGSFNNAPEDFLPWVLTMTRNACIDRLRRRKVRPSTPAVPVEEGPGIPDPALDPEQALMVDSRRRLVHRALAQLSDVNREIIVLKEIQGLEVRQIAEMLGVPIGTVKSRSTRARIELARTVLALDPSYGA